MKAVIIAGGKGKRMLPLTLETSKALIPIHGKPILHHIVASFPEEITELIIIVGYLGDKVREYCGDNFLGRPVTYVEQKEQKGTYHALETVKDLIDENESFCAFYADDLLDKDSLKKAVQYPYTSIVSEVDDISRFGAVLLNEDGTVKEIIEKPQEPVDTNLAHIAVITTKKIFDHAPEPHPENGETYLSLAVASLAKEVKMHVVKSDLWIPIGIIEDIAKAEKILAKD